MAKREGYDRRDALRLGGAFLGGAMLEQAGEGIAKKLASLESSKPKPLPTEAQKAAKPEAKHEAKEGQPGHAKVADLSHEKNAIPTQLLGRRESLNRQNEMADQDGLSRLRDKEAMWQHMKFEVNDNGYMRNKEGEGIPNPHGGYLVELPTNKFLTLDPYLSLHGDFTYYTTGPHHRKEVHQGSKYKRDYCAEWTAEFLTDLAHDYALEFPDAPPLMVSSAVRPWDVQSGDLARVGNRNRSSRSVHPTGAAVDIVWGDEFKKDLAGNAVSPLEKISRPLTAQQKRWLEGRLILLKEKGIVEAEQEGNQPCYHVMVEKNYRDLMNKYKQDLYY